MPKEKYPYGEFLDKLGELIQEAMQEIPIGKIEEALADYHYRLHNFIEDL